MSLLNTVLSPIEMIEHAASIINPVLVLVFAMAGVVGLTMMFMGGWRIFRLGTLGQADPKITLSSVLWSILIGSALLGMDYLIGSSLLTFTGAAKPSPLAYTGPGGKDTAKAIVDIMQFLQLLGALYFFGGMRMLYRLGTNNPRQNEFYGKAWTHILGGLGLIDIAGIAMAIAQLAGASLPL